MDWGRRSGGFEIPRTFPLVILALLKKDIRGEEDPAAVYTELLSHHYGEGFIELRSEAEHAFNSGFARGRERSWRERMAVLENLGFIKTKGTGSQKYKYVLLLHPTTVIQRMREAGQISEDWWNSYTARKTETGELTFEQREAAHKKLADAARLAKVKKKTKS